MSDVWYSDALVRATRDAVLTQLASACCGDQQAPVEFRLYREFGREIVRLEAKRAGIQPLY